MRIGSQTISLLRKLPRYRAAATGSEARQQHAPLLASCVLSIISDSAKRHGREWMSECYRYINDLSSPPELKAKVVVKKVAEKKKDK